MWREGGVAAHHPGGLRGIRVEEGEIDIRRLIGFRIVIGFLTFEDDIPVHPDRDYEN